MQMSPKYFKMSPAEFFTQHAARFKDVKKYDSVDKYSFIIVVIIITFLFIVIIIISLYYY